MTTMLFHKDVFIPDVAKAPICLGKLSYGHHARNVSAAGAYGEIPLPEAFDPSVARLIEAEVDVGSQECVKQVWRQPLDERNDLCFAVLPGGFVKTVWLNGRTDTHKTLDKAKYVTGYNWRCRHKAQRAAAK